MTCTVTNNLQIVEGTRADYESLSHYHYREPNLGPYAAIFAIKGTFRTAAKFTTVSAGHLTVGVIVYSMPTAGVQMRNTATGGLFAGLDKGTRLKLVNKNIRTISRIIIEPRFRSLGLAVRLVKETMPLMNIPIVEALAVMGCVNPFFEKAGMTRFDPPVSADCIRLIEAFSTVGIEEKDLIDPQLVQQKLNTLFTAEHPSSPKGYAGQAAENAEKKINKNNLFGLCGLRGEYTFIERELTQFLQCYGQRRLMQPGIDRTKFILSKLTDRPVYYFWKNPNVELRI